MKKKFATFAEVLEAAGPRPEPSDPGSDKTRYAMKFAGASATFVANGFRSRFPEILPDEQGKGVESPARTYRGLKQLDVNYSEPAAGLGLGISLKSVHIRDRRPNHRFHHNLKRNDEELRAEAAGYHTRQPYAVLVAVIFLPIDACLDGDDSKPSSFGKWVEYLWPLVPREDPQGQFDRFERAFIAIYDPDTAEVGFFDVDQPPPRTGKPAGMLSFEEFVAEVIATYEERNRLDFRWARE